MNNFEDFDLTGKTAFVTGGATGIGYSITTALARSGAKVMIAARREELLKSAAEKITAETGGPQVLYKKLDLSDRANIDEVADQAIEELGGVDIFVGNAACEQFEFVPDITGEATDRVFQINIFSNMSLVTKFVPAMKERQHGRIILCSSGSSIRASAQEGTATYASSKGALNSYARVAATELGRDGITVNTLVLGAYLTDMMQENIDKLDPEFAENYYNDFCSNIALGRMAKPSEIEGVIRLLASDAGSYMTGEEIRMDGGLAIMLKPNLIKN